MKICLGIRFRWLTKLSFAGEDDVVNLPPGNNALDYLSSKNSGFVLICFFLVLVSKIQFGFQFWIRRNNISPLFSTVCNYKTWTECRAATGGL